MTAPTRSLVCSIAAAAIAAATIVSVAHGREPQAAASETGEARDLVNRPDCWTGGAASAFGRCIYQ
jgi:hypothetical protein